VPFSESPAVFYHGELRKPTLGTAEGGPRNLLVFRQWLILHPIMNYDNQTALILRSAFGVYHRNRAAKHSDRARDILETCYFSSASSLSNINPGNVYLS
jgi:hypothetical protein